MNTTTTIPALPGAPGGRALTASDVIRWQEEQAECLGELGFTTNFPDPADIFNPFTINPDFEDELPIDDHSVLVAANQEFRKAIMQVQQRKIIMDGAGAVVAKAEQITDQKLLAAGVPKQDFQDKILRHKIVKLANIEHPPPKANFVEVSVHVDLAIEGQSHILEINLPLEACIAEVYALLGEVVKALLSEKGFLYEGGGKWKYQLVDQDHFRVLQDRSSPLETDLDYILMVQQVSKVGEGKACVAVLTQVCLFPLLRSDVIKNNHSLIDTQTGRSRKAHRHERSSRWVRDKGRWH